VEVNVLTLDAWHQMGRPTLQPSLNVLYMENKTKVMPISVLQDVAITIQGAIFTGDFKLFVLTK
ncbi:hypothetical protein KI387_000805, partial [Taxus chinensis]